MLLHEGNVYKHILYRVLPIAVVCTAQNSVLLCRNKINSMCDKHEHLSKYWPTERWSPLQLATPSCSIMSEHINLGIFPTRTISRKTVRLLATPLHACGKLSHGDSANFPMESRHCTMTDTSTLSSGANRFSASFASLKMSNNTRFFTSSVFVKVTLSILIPAADLMRVFRLLPRWSGSKNHKH